MGTAPAAIEWRCSDRPVPYDDAVAEMERRIAAVRAGSAPELVWLLEHSPLYTAGTSARPADMLDPQRLPVTADELPNLVDALTPAGDVRTLPSMWPERGGIDGFFMARLRRAA